MVSGTRDEKTPKLQPLTRLHPPLDSVHLFSHLLTWRHLGAADTQKQLLPKNPKLGETLSQGAAFYHIHFPEGELYIFCSIISFFPRSPHTDETSYGLNCMIRKRLVVLLCTEMPPIAQGFDVFLSKSTITHEAK